MIVNDRDKVPKNSGAYVTERRRDGKRERRRKRR